MSKHAFIGFIIAFLVIIFTVSMYYSFRGKDVVDGDVESDIDNTPVISETVTPSGDRNNNTNNSNSKTTTNNESNPNVESYTYTNEFGSGDKTTTISAIAVIQLSGFSGASNFVFYIDGSYDLYYLELTNLVKTKLASNVRNISGRDSVIAHYKRPHDVYVENKYVTYKELS